MGTGRLEAFSDGVIAVIITIMVLDLHVPTDASWPTLLNLRPSISIYALSFVLVGILWMNHHHLLRAARTPSAPLLWSNLGLLFAMSLIPFATAYMASAHGSPLPVACYSVAMALTSATFTVLTIVVALQQPAGASASFRSYTLKGIVVSALYLVAIPLGFVSVAIAYTIFVAIPIFYIIPGRVTSD